MSLQEKQAEFEKTAKVYESAKVTFAGVEGYDVYNPSIPFTWDGKEYIFGRIERRSEWARSWVRLFEKTGEDAYRLVPDSMIYQLEDPYLAVIHGELVMGGTHVRNRAGVCETYYGYFYKGTDLNDLYYYTTGPDYMKDIRLIEMKDGKIGVFSRPRGTQKLKELGIESMIGFTTISSLDELTADVIENAPYIENLFEAGEWGGCNQVYLLDSGLLGVIGHKSYLAPDETGLELQHYLNISFVFDPQSHRAMDVKIIGTRKCYPEGPCKKPNLADCVFTSGITLRPDGKVNLYTGLGDCEVGRIVIDNPFAGYGSVISPLK